MEDRESMLWVGDTKSRGQPIFLVVKPMIMAKNT